MARDIDQLCIDTIRTLSIDAIQKDGHSSSMRHSYPVSAVLGELQVGEET